MMEAIKTFDMNNAIVSSSWILDINYGKGIELLGLVLEIMNQPIFGFRYRTICVSGFR